MNDENLIPGAHKLTVEEQSKGGKASGVARSFRSAAKRRLKEHPELFDESFDMLIDEMRNGNLRALELLLELSGESPKQMELALKKRELKLKEQSKDTATAVLEKLDEVLGGIESGF